MTITIKITNEGPHAGSIMYYDDARQFQPRTDTLQPGESITVNVWDGNLPVILPCAAAADGPRMFRSPPATSAPRHEG